MTSKKKKNKNRDFQKTKLKVGKGKVPAANATDTSFKAKALTLGAQYKHTVNLEGDSERPIKLLFNNLSNPSQSVKLASVSGLKELMGGEKAAAHFDDMLKAMTVVLVDADDEVRKSSIDLVKLMLETVEPVVLESFSRTLAALCANLLSHINWAVKLDGLKVINALLAKMLTDKFFVERTESSLLGLLMSTKRKELRNEILLTLRRLFGERKSFESEKSVIFDFDSDLIAAVLKRPVVCVSRRLSRGVGGGGAIVGQTKTPKETFDSMKAALEQAWIECLEGRCGRAEVELITGLLDLVEHLAQRGVKLGHWIRARLATPFPAPFKAASITRAKLNIKLAVIYIDSTKTKRQDASESKLLRQMNTFVIDTLRDERDLDPELSRLLLSLGCSLHSRLQEASEHKVEQHALDYILDIHLGERKQLNATRRTMLNELLAEMNNQKVCAYLSTNIGVFIEELFGQHKVAFSELNMALSMGLEESIQKCLVTLNHLIRTAELDCPSFPSDRLGQVFLMDSRLQMSFVDILYLMPKEQINQLLVQNGPVVAQHWESELLEPKTLVRLIPLLLVSEKTLSLATTLLFRQSVDNQQSAKPVQEAVGRVLRRFSREQVDTILAGKSVCSREQSYSVVTLIQVLLVMDPKLTENSIKSALSVIFGEFEDSKKEVEGVLVHYSLLVECLKEKRFANENEGKEFGEYVLTLVKILSRSECWSLFEMLVQWSTSVWWQLLKSQLSALT